MLWACVIHGAQFMISRQKQRSPQLVAQEQSQSTALIPIIGFFTIYFKHWANKISTKKLSWLLLLTLTLLQRQSSKMWQTCISRLIIIYRYQMQLQDPKLKTNETNFLFLFSYTCNNNRKNLHVIENGQDISLSFIIIPSNSHSFAAATSRSFDHHRVTNFISYPNCILIILQKHYKLK